MEREKQVEIRKQIFSLAQRKRWYHGTEILQQYVDQSKILVFLWVFLAFIGYIYRIPGAPQGKRFAVLKNFALN